MTVSLTSTLTPPPYEIHFPDTAKSAYSTIRKIVLIRHFWNFHSLSRSCWRWALFGRTLTIIYFQYTQSAFCYPLTFVINADLKALNMLTLFQRKWIYTYLYRFDIFVSITMRDNPIFGRQKTGPSTGKARE